jgi:2-keto-4-pentenoate hydratase/2-oxohepta-3-ene-1,7-dioic acid hydratase in catechol pathway
MEHVFGYTIVNDISARDLQLLPSQVDYLAGKGRDTFLPMGPGIRPRDEVPDYGALTIRLWVNGELRQSAPAGEMTRGVEALIAELSRGRTLQAGDVIATGTPAGVALEMDPQPWLRPGDVVKTEIDGIGSLVNEVRARGREER